MCLPFLKKPRGTTLHTGAHITWNTHLVLSIDKMPYPQKYENHMKSTLWSVLVFGPESVSYEISRRKNRTKFHEISARVFLENIKSSIFNDIYNIKIFRILILKMDSFANVSVTRPGRPAARPPVRPSILDQNWIRMAWVPVSPFQNWIKMIDFQYFHVQNWIKMTCVPIFS